MLKLTGYAIINKIYEGLKTIVYRGYRTLDKHPVILKALETRHFDPKTVAQFHHDYEMTKNLSLPNIIECYGLHKNDQAWVLILEDIQGESLRNIISKQQIDLTSFLHIARSIAEGLEQLHAHHIIHKNIKPANIIVNLQTGVVKITDFSLSSRFTHENKMTINSALLEETLTYVSPEQTGYFNRSLDYRTDFYSLGAVCYEMLVGCPPFESQDRIELVHCHTSQLPSSPHQVNSDIPRPVSDIIMKLLAKRVESRYQSAVGLKMDLQAALQQLQETGSIGEFILGQHDISDEFQISPTIYQRASELDLLRQALGRVSQGSGEMMLVTGESGIGKSFLVNEISKDILDRRGYLVRGQFDSLDSFMPYRAIVNAGSDLVRQLLIEDEIPRWRDKLLAALSPNAQVIIELMPALEQILGKQPAVPTLKPVEARNRFNLVFQEFIRVLCQPGRPLIMVLDNLQWADPATLNLVELMMTGEEIHHLFLIGLSREVNESHPLMTTIKKLQKQNVVINHLALSPLPLESLTQFLVETVHRENEVIKPLVQWIMNKTGGNPFFVKQLLKTLYEEKQIKFQHFDGKSANETNNNCGIWQWDIRSIEGLNVAATLVDLMIDPLKKLPKSTQQVLGLAAGIGHLFELNFLSLVYQETASQTYQDLLPAIKKGLIQEFQFHPLPITHYQFFHHSILEAAYALIEEDQKAVIHLKIGQLLSIKEELFEKVEHLRRGQALMLETEERFELARLSLEVGKKAKTLLAHAAADNYLTLGLGCLRESDWATHYDLVWALHKEKIEVESLNDPVESLKPRVELILAQTKTVLEPVEIYNLLVIHHTRLGQHEVAIQVGFQALQLLEIEWINQDFSIVLKTELDEVVKGLGQKDIASLINEPRMTQLEVKAAVQLLGNMTLPASFSNQLLAKVIQIKIANLSLKYGHVAESSLGYAYCGLVLSQVNQQHQLGYEWGCLALQLSDQFNDLTQKGKVCWVLGSYFPWIKPLKSVETVNEAGFQAALASGEFSAAGEILFNSISAQFFQGKPLDSLKTEITSFWQSSQKIHNVLSSDILLGYQIALSNLQGLTEKKLSFHHDHLAEAQYLAACEQNGSAAAICAYQIIKSQLLYLYDKPAKALDCSHLAEKILPVLADSVLVVEHNFYYSLILTALYLKVSKAEQCQYWERLTANQKRMKSWADSCPDNFLHKYLLVEAEKARISGEVLEAMDWYDLAIQSAQENEFVQNEALANELAAQFWLTRGKEDFAQLYLKKAYLGYQRWGAKYKVKELLENYPLWLTTMGATTFMTDQGMMVISPSNPPETTSVLTSVLGADSEIPLDLMPFSPGTPSERVLDCFIKKFMPILVKKKVGAEQAWLILKKDLRFPYQAAPANEHLVEGLFLEALATPDEVQILKPIPLASINSRGNTQVALSKAIVMYVANTQTPVILSDARQNELFANDPYILHRQPKSILCFPILMQNQLIGLFYLENNQATGAFTSECLALLKWLSTQIAIPMENALFYAQLDQVGLTTEPIETTCRAQNTFLANISHELRTPLNAIIGYSEIIQEDAEILGYEDILPDIEKIQTAGIQLLGIITDILEISKIEANELELNLTRFSVVQLIEDMAVTFQLMVEMEGNAFLIEYGDELGELYADYNKVGQILLNLLSNAAKFTNQGTVTLTVTRKSFSADSSASEWLYFEIADTGIGIPSDKKDIIFEAFTQADNSTTREYGGMGLGLTISNHFCRAMGGQISITSEVGKGSLFTVQLPARMSS